MRGLDDTDREIISLLLEDARRPYSDIADQVGLSAPAVSDRVDRLQETGLIRRFTADLDRALLAGGTSILVTVEATPGHGQAVADALASADPVEHVFRTADDLVVCTATVEDPETVTEYIDNSVRDYEIRYLAGHAWTPRLGGTDLAPACVECDNTVTREGETETLDGEVYHFCCENCRDAFLDRYERMREEA